MRTPQEAEKLLRFVKRAALAGTLVICPAEVIIEYLLGGENAMIAEFLATMERSEQAAEKARRN